MATEGAKSFSQSYPMAGGDGACSYTRNSSYQQKGAIAAKEMIDEAIKEKLDLKIPCFHGSKVFRIADFGCSVGPNTFIAVQHVIEAVKLKYHDEYKNHTPLEFQVFFNDHTKNDFNTLFTSLPSYQSYFAAGVPGTFYGRLFPKSSIHFAHCSYALHWLSKIPKEIVDKTSSAWNKDSIHYTESAEEVVKAYFDQFKNDLDTFLNSRAQEIVGGGLIAILLSGLPEGLLISQTVGGKFLHFLGSCLKEMAQLGVISKEKVDSFNIPIYYSTPKEFEEITKRNGYFSIEKMDILNNPPMATKPSVEMTASHLMATFGGLLREHFENENIVEKIFQYFSKKLVGDQSAYIHDESLSNQSVDLFIVLKRNIDA